MKLTKYIFCTVLVIGMLGITLPCYAETSGDKASMEEVKRETQDLLQALSAYTVEQRDELLRKTKAALDKLDKRIEALEKRVDEGWDKMDTAAREKARASLTELRRQRAQAAEKYGALKNSSGEAWEHVKKGFSEAYKTLNDAWEKSEKEYGPDK